MHEFLLVYADEIFSPERKVTGNSCSSTRMAAPIIILLQGKNSPPRLYFFKSFKMLLLLNLKMHDSVMCHIKWQHTHQAVISIQQQWHNMAITINGRRKLAGTIYCACYMVVGLVLSSWGQKLTNLFVSPSCKHFWSLFFYLELASNCC